MSPSRPDDIAYLTGSGAGARPSMIGVTFGPNAAPLVDPGNMVICDLDPDSTATAACRRSRPR
ncbi:MAG: hypothetical protein AAGE13_15190 [Pseudomonadota bacterium]